MSSIKTNFALPVVTDLNGIQLQSQRLAQDLSSNFKGILGSIDNVTTQLSSLQTAVAAILAPVTLAIGYTLGEFISFTINSSNVNRYITYSHSLGIVPQGVWVCNNTSAHPTSIITYGAFNSSTVTLAINDTAGASPAYTVTVYIVG